jgi:SagB-type dehydrogenase family enzyme
MGSGMVRLTIAAIMAALAIAAIMAALAIAATTPHAPDATSRPDDSTPLPGLTKSLPPPRITGSISLEEALAQRRSVRAFSSEPLSDGDIGQLLWAAQGITAEGGRRTAPSAGALYPLELYAVTPDGLWRYLPAEHALAQLSDSDLRIALQGAALGQRAVGAAPLVVVITGVVERIEARYGPERAPRYVHLEAGHAAQGLLLQAVALDLGAVPIGAFTDRDVAQILGLPADEAPLYLLPVGRAG